ncbi:MAG: Ni/Fe hydrogenase subunit alpha [Nitrososphaeria archaeon]
MEKVYEVNPLTRVEGEGRIYVRVKENMVEDVKVNIYEPPRFFEAFLLGRSYKDVPDIVARICGICPVAYQMSSTHAIEKAFNLEVDQAIEKVRRLLYCGEWIQSHALHFFLLALPDFFGLQDVFELMKVQPDVVKAGLEVKKAGNSIMALIGGRSIHPVSPCVGGFTDLPPEYKFKRLIEQLKNAERNVLKVSDWIMENVKVPELKHELELVSLWDQGNYPMIYGKVASSSGLRVNQEDYDKYFEEYQVEHSTALHSKTKEGKTYIVGPLSRFKLNVSSLYPHAKQFAEFVNDKNVYMQNIARFLEMLHSLEEAIEILGNYKELSRSKVPVEPKKSSGAWITEAPRGMLYHRYELDDSGRIKSAKIIPPTSQNLANMEDNLKALLESRRHESDEELVRLSGMLIRSYDPCISCSAHALQIKIDR